LLPKDKNLVIDGLRFAEDHAFLKERFGQSFIHVHIISDTDIRRKRYLSKATNDKDFEIAEKHGVEGGIWKLSKLADFTIYNNCSLATFAEEINKIVNRILVNG
jgi:dephospho-CoA kinase